MNKLVKNKTIYLVSLELKNEILRYITNNKLLLDIHFFSFNEFIKRAYFDYDYNAIYHLSKKFNISFSNAKSFINEMKYLMYGNKINDSKYEKLSLMKSYLDELKLLQYDSKFLDYLKNYNIVTDLELSSPFIDKINSLLNNKIETIHNEKKEEINIYEYVDSENEIEDLANKISNLLVNNISPNNIHILNYSEEYYTFIDKTFTFYNIPFNLKRESYLFDLQYIKSLYNAFINEEELVFNSNFNSLNNSFIDCLNSTSFIENKNDKNKLLLFLLKSTKIKDDNYNNIINFDTNIGYLLNGHYYFFIGLNNKVFPKYKKDEGYFSDANKLEIGYLTSYNSNKIMKEFYLEKFKANSMLRLSYRKADYFNSYSQSDLVNLLVDKPLKNIKTENKYSSAYDKLKFTRELDNYYKFNNKSEELIRLLNYLNKDEYKSYENKYTPINKDVYHTQALNNQISISSSSLETFSKCKFRYYLNTILKETDDRFSNHFGSLCHHILEHIYEDDFDFEKYVNNYESEYIPTELEKILLEQLLEDLKDKIVTIQEQYKRTNLKDIKHELHLTIYDKNKLSIKIHGYVDKLMLDNENRAIVVDYKTKEQKPSFKYLDYGLDNQLAFYFYLLNKSKDYADVFLVGCYLQVLNFKLQSTSSYKKDLQLDGYTYNDENVISLIDNDYNNKSFIQGIAPNSKGLGTHAKLFDKNLFDEIINKMDLNINNMIDDINNVNFEINPKILKDNSTTCKYCKYNDICFHTYSNYIDLREGGEEDEVDE
jgi:ATP-dependent helicase/DNAse subunit B